ncbi:ABC transporter permease [Nitrospirillum sp. BR 11828]|uniref:ABC transporter permease n=1 Tax=Nitrospirillum sp. BR 11828 TaxID=3104325 RepID=UPI002ACA1D18|nr:ABC transporter permease [Nitrospirillum sp. BR 11828]MDZ5650358.1 ABC transporter permease [Nitrospirillum sp. BR 11828]
MNHLLPAFLRRHALITLLNIAGLAVGIAAVILMLVYVVAELRVDRGFTAADRLYRVATTLTVPGQGTMLAAGSPPQMAAPLLAEFPEVEAATRVFQDQVVLKVGDRPFDVPLLWADANLLQVLDYPLARGDAATALSRPDGLVLSPELARRLFGDADPLGRVVQTRDGTPLTVTGVLARLAETHLDFTAIAAEAARGPNAWARQTVDDWSQPTINTYVRLRPGVSVDAVRARLPDFLDRHNTLPPQLLKLALRLDPVGDIHLHVSALGDHKPGGDMAMLRILAGVAALILGVAVANYTNLATAQAINRAREVGVRKLVGARRRQLVALFLGEAMLLTLVATLLALALVELALPVFQDLLGRTWPTDVLRQGPLPFMIMLTPVIVGALGGFYPAMVLSGYRPGEVLKGRAQAPRAGRVRAVLVVTQFAVSIALMIVTLTVYRQVEHARAADLGYRADDLYTLGRLPSGDARAATLKAEVARIPGVRSVSLTSLVPANQSRAALSIRPPEGTAGAGRDQRVSLAWFMVDEDFIATYGATLVAGSGTPAGWKPGAARPDGATDYALATVEATRRMGYARPEDAVGRSFRFLDTDPPTRIVGVLADMRFRSARERPEALLFTVGGDASFLNARLASGDQAAAVAAIDAVVQRLYPEVEHWRRGFAQDQIAALYAGEDRQAKVFALFSALAIVLANLGLFGLTALAAARRTKEIGIRRVAGARARDIAWLMTWQFARPVLLANLLAWPLAWWGLHRWLGQFAVRVDQGPGTFLAAGAVALAIAAATVAVHVLRLTLAPPAGALRYE